MVTVNRFVSEILAAVEYTSRVEERGVYYPVPNMHVETDYAFGGFDVACASLNSVEWLPDPDYKTQVMGVFTTPFVYYRLDLKLDPSRTYCLVRLFRLCDLCDPIR